MNFLDRVLEKLKCKISSKSVQWEPCRLTDGETDRRTDMTKIIVGIYSFANASKNISIPELGFLNKDSILV